MNRTLPTILLAAALATPAARADTCGGTVQELPAACENATRTQYEDLGWGVRFRCDAPDGSYLVAQGTNKPDGGPYTHFDLDRHEYGGVGIRARLGTASVDTIIGQDWGHQSRSLPDCYEIFSDGFESGDTSRWSGTNGCFGSVQGMPFQVLNGTLESRTLLGDWGTLYQVQDADGQPLSVQAANHPDGQNPLEQEVCITSGNQNSTTQVCSGDICVGNGYGCRTGALPVCGYFPGQ